MEEQNENNTKAVDEKSGVLSLAKSFATKLATVGIIWGWGYMNWSIAWLIGPVILSVWKMEKKRDNELRRITAQAMAMSQEKQIIMNRLDELPSWVYFPDFDRAEWLNRILYKTWPSMNEFVRGLVKQSIQPAIVERLADYKMKGFQFERLVLGRIPAKICGIKVYDKNTSRNEIILDADILYAGDCDITFSFGNLKGGIKDFQIRGMIRVVMKPMIPVMPLIGGLQIFFLNNPTIDFNLVGAVDVLDLPGFSDVLRKTIVEQIGAILVLPNKLAIPLSPEIPAEMLKTPEPEGVLRIHVVQAKHLMKKDIGMLGKGKSDPYAVINIGAEEFRTKTIDNTVDPKWDYWCEFVVQDGVGHCSRLTARLFDKDNTGQDDPLGRATIEVNRVKLKGTIDTWVALELAKHGMVHLRLTWLQLTKNVSDLSAALNEIHQLRVTSLSSALLILYIDSAKNLPCLKGNKQPDVYLEASVSNRSKRTTTMLRSCDPVWEQGFTFLVSNPENDTLQIKLHDEKTGTIIGVMSFNLSLLLDKEHLEIIQQPYTLQNASEEAKLVLSMALRILKYEEPECTFEEDEDDHDINELNKKIERQESNNTPSSSIPPSPLKKQSSKESVHSVASSAISSSAGGLIVAAPVAEESIEETITSDSAALPIQAAPGLIHRNLSVTSSAGEAKLGRIQLTLRYSVPRQKLIVVVHKVAHAVVKIEEAHDMMLFLLPENECPESSFTRNGSYSNAICDPVACDSGMSHNLPLPQNDPSNIPDPYVKLYLLPDKHKETKRKTAVMKDNCSPVFDEQFDYVISQADLESRTLEISVCTQKGWLSTGSNVMGQVHMTFADMDLTQPLTSWYDLMPENKD